MATVPIEPERATYTCVVCGYDQLCDEPYDNHGNPSHEVCLCCGFEFGFTDGSMSITQQAYRSSWIATGYVFYFEPQKPAHWTFETLQQQLRNIGIEISS